MPFDGLTSQPDVNRSLRAPGIVTAWPRRQKGGSGSHAIALSSDGGRVEPDGRRPGRKNHDRAIVGGGSMSATYGGRDRLESMTVNSQGITYKINAFGQRVSMAFSGATTHYVHDILGNIIAEADGSTGTTTVEYVWMEGELLAQVDGSGNIVYVHNNQVKMPQKITNPSRTLVFDQIIEPFGDVSSTPTSTTPTNIRFPGQYADANNALYHNNNRDFDPNIGYIQHDPLGFGGGYNPFSYASQNPTERIDPWGLVTDNLEPTYSFGQNGGNKSAGLDMYNPEGWCTIGGEGTADSIQGNNANALAALIELKKGCNNGEPIRLVACNTGVGDANHKSLAEQVKDSLALLGDDRYVEGANAPVWVNPQDGLIGVYLPDPSGKKPDYNQPGWFSPGGPGYQGHSNTTAGASDPP